MKPLYTLSEFSLSIVDHFFDVIDQELDLKNSTSSNDICESIYSEKYGFQIFLPNTLPELESMERELVGSFQFKRLVDDDDTYDVKSYDLKGIVERIQDIVNVEMAELFD